MTTQNTSSGIFGTTSDITRAGEGKFPNPFCDIASEYVPRDLDTIFECCEYLMMAVTPFMSVSQRVVRYFLTELVLEGESDDEREKCEDFLDNKLHIMQQLAEVGDDYMCLHGDTLVPTRQGTFPIRELEGRTVDVIAKDGIYRPAAFKAYGEQELLEVEFANGDKILATPEHNWHVFNMSNKAVEVPTSSLRPGYHVPRVVAPRPEQGEEFREGVRHGFVFGDGSTYNKTRKTPRCVANFFGAKDAALLPYFEGHGSAPSQTDGREPTRVHGLPSHYKTLPASDASPEYWYGFVCGFHAADGGVDKCGCPVLTQADEGVLAAIKDQLPRIGMVGGPVRGATSKAEFTRADGTEYTFTGSIFYMGLKKRFMRPNDFLIPAHRANFEACPPNNYGKTSLVRSVRRTGIRDTVYCCVEPETHAFVVGNGILTGNCYGQSFVSIYFPFDRYLQCPKCGTTYHIKTIQYKFDRKDGTFRCSCNKCGVKGEVFRREDRRSANADLVKLIRWSPKDIRLRVHPISGEVEHYLRLDSAFVEKTLSGEPFYLDSTPWAMVLACVQNTQESKEYLFKFKKDSIYHLKTGTLAGLPIKGWGIPPILPNFKLAYYVQLLRRMDEAIALDFIVPFRVLYPENKGGDDPLSLMNTGSFVAQMKNMVANKRKNITDIQIAPVPIGYQLLGGEAKQLAPKDNIALAIDELLNSLGFPAELWKGSLTIQAAPMALRLFEKSWNGLVDGYDELISWVLSRLRRHFMWGEITGALRSVTLADDIERKALNLQAAAGMDISKQTAYRPLGLDYLEEQKRVVEEQEAIQTLQQEAMERAQAQEGEPQPGPDGQAAPGATPGDVEEQAQALAQQLLLQTPETMRRGELIKIKHSNSTLHALVLQKMDQMRQDMSRQGQAMIMEQAKQAEVIGLGPARALPSPLRLSLLISDQITDYNRADMRKIASDIGRKVPHAREAFSFIYRRIMGWD